MRNAGLFIASAALVIGSPVLSASADYFLVIKGISQASGGPIYLKVTSSGDLDGDGVPDEGIVRLTCTGSKLRAASFQQTVLAPRDTASGLATGKRADPATGPWKEWNPASPQLYQLRVTDNVGLPKITPKIAKESHGRAAADGWQPLSLADSATICAAASEAVRTAGADTGRLGGTQCPGGASGGAAGIAITEEGGLNQHADKPRPKGLAMAGPGGPKTSASQSGQTLRHAINTKGTGATGRAEAAADPAAAGKYSSPINISSGYAAASCPEAPVAK